MKRGKKKAKWVVCSRGQSARMCRVWPARDGVSKQREVIVEAPFIATTEDTTNVPRVGVEYEAQREDASVMRGTSALCVRVTSAVHGCKCVAA